MPLNTSIMVLSISTFNQIKVNQQSMLISADFHNNIDNDVSGIAQSLEEKQPSMWIVQLIIRSIQVTIRSERRHSYTGRLLVMTSHQNERGDYLKTSPIHKIPILHLNTDHRRVRTFTALKSRAIFTSNKNKELCISCDIYIL